jgi:3-deoxy-D-manno-octulosonate 8-phosphate phosphatase (KDO 8-P phosphatase)
MSLEKKAAKIKAIVMDIDGVLTDGRGGYSAGDEIKFFHVRDGAGIKMAIRAGLKVGALSGRSAEANRKRAGELGFSFLYEGQKNKGDAFEILLKENELLAEECVYIGDDLIDIPVMTQVGVAVAVADAASSVADYCDFKTKTNGGYGAVREVIEWLLKEQGKWEEQLKRYIP